MNAKQIQTNMHAQRPILRADASLRANGEMVEVELGEDIFEVAGAPPKQALHVLSMMNGRFSVQELANRAQLPSSIVASIISGLAPVGVICDSAIPTGRIDPAEFSMRCRTLYVQWKQRLFSHPLWGGLAQGSLPKSVFIGWVIESWWFIEGVMDRLPMAVSCTEDRAVRAVFAKHFAEEWDHYTFFEAALDALGVAADARRKARPLPATAAVQHWMRNSARRDPLRYAACSGFLESTGQDRVAARSFFDHVGRSYDNGNRDVVSPMAAHVALDEDYGHSGFIEKVSRLLGPIDRQRAELALQDVYGLVETLEMWSGDIMRFYAQPDALPLHNIRAYAQVPDHANHPSPSSALRRL